MEKNNKGRRNEMTELKFKKRLKLYGLDLNTEVKHNFYAFKSTGSPCSCPMCSPDKFKRTEKHKKRFDEEE